jgi:hypothetical protein
MVELEPGYLTPKIMVSLTIVCCLPLNSKNIRKGLGKRRSRCQTGALYKRRHWASFRDYGSFGQVVLTAMSAGSV